MVLTSRCSATVFTSPRYVTVSKIGESFALVLTSFLTGHHLKTDGCFCPSSSQSQMQPAVCLSLCEDHIWGPKTGFILLSDIFVFVDIGHPLLREDESHNCCWSSPAQSSSGLNPAGIITTLYTVSDSRLPQSGGPGPRKYMPLGTGWPSYNPRHWVLYDTQRCGGGIRTRFHVGLTRLPWRLSLYSLGTDRTETSVPVE
jgi:hypothetical protein